MDKFYKDAGKDQKPNSKLIQFNKFYNFIFIIHTLIFQLFFVIITNYIKHIYIHIYIHINKMINYFLNQSLSLTTQKRKLIQKKFLSRRKYNPFHLDCEYSRKKLCYCKKNPIAYLTQCQKAHLWTNSFMKPYQFYQNKQYSTTIQPSKTKPNESQQSKIPPNIRTRDTTQQNTKQINYGKIQKQAARQFNTCIQKIRVLSKQEIVKFIHEQSRKYRNCIMENLDNGGSMANMY